KVGVDGMDDLTSFAQWLRQRRKARDLTQEELADRIGSSPETIRKIEAGRRRPSKQMVELVAEHLGLPREAWPNIVHLARIGPGADDSTLHIIEAHRDGPPGGAVTFLFTDIEGSTRRWEQQPEAMQAALARHDAILR